MSSEVGGKSNAEAAGEEERCASARAGAAIASDNSTVALGRYLLACTNSIVGYRYNRSNNKITIPRIQVELPQKIGSFKITNSSLIWYLFGTERYPMDSGTLSYVCTSLVRSQGPA